MQQIKVKEVREVKGKSGKVFYAVVDDKGGEFTTFDTKIASVTPGSVLEIEPKVDGKYVNITEWKVLEEGKQSATSVNGKAAYGKIPEQFDAERRSIESQTAFNGIIKLIEQEAILKIDIVPSDVEELAYEWARVRLRGTIPAKEAPVVSKTGQIKVDSTQKAIAVGHFENAGQFAAAAFKEFGLNTTDLSIRFSVTSVSGITDLDEAWKKLVSDPSLKKK